MCYQSPEVASQLISNSILFGTVMYMSSLSKDACFDFFATERRSDAGIDRIEETHDVVNHRDVVCVTVQIILNSMHRYQPRIYVVESRDVSNTSPMTSVDGLSTFVFAETQFIAVTAYQNDKVHHCSAS